MTLARSLLGLTLGLMTGGAASVATAQTVQTGSQVILDGNARIVGPVLDYRTTTLGVEFAGTSFLVDGEPVQMELSAASPSFLRPSGPPFVVAFTTMDCSGTAYFTFFDNQPQAFADVALINETISSPQLVAWRPIPGEPPQALIYQSFLRSDGGCEPQSLAQDGVPAERIETGFVPPYSIAGAGGGSSALSVPAVSGPGLAVLILALAVIGWAWLGRR